MSDKGSFIHELRRELCGEIERYKNRVLVLLEENRKLKKELAEARKASMQPHTAK